MTELHHFKCKDGREIEIEISEWPYAATARTTDGQEIGRLEFRELDDPNGMHLRLSWAFMDLLGPTFKFQGIGEQCLRLMSDASGLPITAAQEDEQPSETGEHLTGDAPGFVSRMRAKGLIST